MIDDTLVDVTDLIKRHRAEREERDARLAAQDSDKCEKYFESVWSLYVQTSGGTVPTTKNAARDFFVHGQASRLPLPMSAEVEKAIETVQDYMKTTRDWYEQGHAELGDYLPPLESEGDVAFNVLGLIVAALKERDARIAELELLNDDWISVNNDQVAEICRLESALKEKV